jgi:hypothetical protein
VRKAAATTRDAMIESFDAGMTAVPVTPSAIDEARGRPMNLFVKIL